MGEQADKIVDYHRSKSTQPIYPTRWTSLHNPFRKSLRKHGNTSSPSIQLALSGLLSTAYAMVMMAVIVGTALQLGEDGVASPSAVFLISMVGSFFIAACLHPQEFWCIVPGIIYLASSFLKYM